MENDYTITHAVFDNFMHICICIHIWEKIQFHMNLFIHLRRNWTHAQLKTHIHELLCMSHFVPYDFYAYLVTLFTMLPSDLEPGKNQLCTCVLCMFSQFSKSLSLNSKVQLCLLILSLNILIYNN